MERIAAKLADLPVEDLAVGPDKITMGDPDGGGLYLSIVTEIGWDTQYAYRIAAAVVPNPVLMFLEFHDTRLAKQIVERLVVGDDAPLMIDVRDRFVEAAAAPAEFDSFHIRARDAGSVLLYDADPPSLPRLAEDLQGLPWEITPSGLLHLRWEQGTSVGLDVPAEPERWLLGATRTEAATLVGHPVYALMYFRYHLVDRAREVLGRIVHGGQPPVMVKVRDHFVQPEAALADFHDLLDVFFVRGDR